MNPIDWLRCKQPGFTELSEGDRDVIGYFVFLWSLFEARVLDNHARAEAIVNAAIRWSKRGVLTQETFQAEQAYVRNRYCPGGQFSYHFDHLKLRPPDKEELVRRFLKQECWQTWEGAAGLLIVVYRLRNNLFHGLKWAYDIRDQSENFVNANAALMKAVDLESFEQN